MPDSDVQRSVRMVNLGCAKNLVDAEEMLGVMQRDGYRIVGADGAASVVVVNTCGFIESAKTEAIDAILEAVEAKRRGEVERVVVAGCLAQRYAAELATEIPEVDAFTGVGQMGAISSVVEAAFTRRDAPVRALPPPAHRWLDKPVRVRATAPWTAYLKISEGCDHRCTFCAIPAIRGAHVSKPLDRVVAEARALAESGVQDLNLIAQDSTQYGYDLERRQMLPELLRAVSAVDGLRWIRLFYCYPSRLTARVIESIANTPRVCAYVDMPLQHSNDRVLRQMARPANQGRYLRLVERLRAASPDIAIRTTFIVGFPGETDEEFEDLMRFAAEARFDRAGVFEYSTEDATPAAAMRSSVPEAVRRERRDRFMRQQRTISEERGARWIGRDIEVLVESASSRAGRPDRIGRSFRDAPEIDGLVRVLNCAAAPGEFVTARVTAAQPYDLLATC